MRWPSRSALYTRLDSGLAEYSRRLRNLPGIGTPDRRDTLVMQLIASGRRLDYTRLIQERDISPRRADSRDAMFDPERAAVLHARAGRVDEAIWLVFLAIHFGKHPRHGWRRLRDVYSGLGTENWTWARVCSDLGSFRRWLQENRHRIGGAFGNHRKYESIDGMASAGTGSIVASYIEWIGPEHSHAKRFAELTIAGGNDVFDNFYRAMNIIRFGRLAKFDFLCLLGRLHLSPLRPRSTYLVGATGPLRGARLLFGGDHGASIATGTLEGWISKLDDVLDVGMQIMEDALCNWQKSPGTFIDFRG